MAITIMDVKAFALAPARKNLVVVKVETSEPGLYGLGCATFTQRYLAVITAIEKYMKPFLIGKDPSRIEDIWQTSMVSSYWRNGPVLNNAIAGVDMALWDIKGKMANMPLYQLFGGKCRDAVLVYAHAEGSSIEETLDETMKLKEDGFRNVRMQVGGYGGKKDEVVNKSATYFPGVYYDPKDYMRTVIKLFEQARIKFGDEISLSHDVHERLSPADSIAFAKKMEQFDLFYLEDCLPPEQAGWFRHIRSNCITPLAMGELFVNSNEWINLVKERLIDYIRVHLSMIGGITPALKLIALCDAFGIRTAWHGPDDLTPIGYAVNAHLDLSSPNFGIQEWYTDFSEVANEIFPGSPEVRNGYLYINDRPGIGIEFNEKAAAKYPAHSTMQEWMPPRIPDGTSARP